MMRSEYAGIMTMIAIGTENYCNGVTPPCHRYKTRRSQKCKPKTGNAAITLRLFGIPKNVPVDQLCDRESDLDIDQLERELYWLYEIIVPCSLCEDLNLVTTSNPTQKPVDTPVRRPIKRPAKTPVKATLLRPVRLLL